MFDKRSILIASLALLATLAFFDLTSADLLVQNWFFDAARGDWVWNRHEPISRFLLYDGIKLILMTSAMALVGLLAFAGRIGIRRHIPAMRMVLLSLILVPSVVGVLKASTNVACPRDLQPFGGSLPYVKLFEPYPEGQRPARRQRCFPAGHASSGFALIATAFLFRDRFRRRAALAASLALAWAMGLYKMAIGDHFLSHTLVSMELAWLVIALLNLIPFRTARREALPGSDRV